ncbi:MAG TPA: hypothetical protein PKH39_01180 [Woeseiaceae bacterium]|nr:hypothetical protein [Woeseiaceae bacterium]
MDVQTEIAVSIPAGFIIGLAVSVGTFSFIWQNRATTSDPEEAAISLFITPAAGFAGF